MADNAGKEENDEETRMAIDRGTSADDAQAYLGPTNPATPNKTIIAETLASVQSVHRESENEIGGVMQNGPKIAGDEAVDSSYFLHSVDQRLSRLESSLTSVGNQLAFVPPQVRVVAKKIDGIATAISGANYRSLLLGLLGVYDLVDQLVRSTEAEAGRELGADHRQNYQTIRDQLSQLLHLNGLVEIPAEGLFDPRIHRAIQTVPCESEEKSDRIVELIRPGFRSEQSVLRYAEVVVTRYLPVDHAADPFVAGEEDPRKD
jgi:molecular chaperone GrpE (heat shock protein)